MSTPTAPGPVNPPATLEQWRAACRDRGIDPLEVEMVSARYAAYRQYRGEGGLSLEDWFRYYRIEKESETGQGDGLVSGCSATGESNEQSCLTRPAQFLEVLRAHVQLSQLH